MKFLWKYLHKYARRMSLVMSIKLLGTLLELLIPYVMEHLIDHVVPIRQIPLVLIWGVGMVGLAFCPYLQCERKPSFCTDCQGGNI